MVNPAGLMVCRSWCELPRCHRRESGSCESVASWRGVAPPPMALSGDRAAAHASQGTCQHTVGGRREDAIAVDNKSKTRGATNCGTA